MFTHIDLNTGFGTIYELAKEAVEIANKTNFKVSFKFNAVKVNVTKHTDVIRITEKALEAQSRKINSVFGEGW